MCRNRIITFASFASVQAFFSLFFNRAVRSPSLQLFTLRFTLSLLILKAVNKKEEQTESLPNISLANELKQCEVDFLTRRVGVAKSWTA